MAYPPNSSAFVDEEASDAVKRFCRGHCKLKRGEIAADIDQRLTIGSLLCLARHRKTEMTADMHVLDSQLGLQCSSDKKGRDNVIKLARQRLSALQVFKKNYKKMAGKAGLMAQLRWVTQRPWDYPLTPGAKSTKKCCPAIQEAIAAEAKAEAAEAQRPKEQEEQPLGAVQATQDPIQNPRTSRALMTFFEVAEEALGGLAPYYHDPTKRRHIVMRQAFAFLVRALFWNMELNRGLCICIVFRNMISSRRLKGRWGPRPSGGPFQTFLQMWEGAGGSKRV
jgi:hypothetical protein